MSKLLFIPKIKIHNANALSSPFTIGFPAITSWLGFTHALQRKLNQNGFDQVLFTKTGIVNHKFNLHVHKGYGDYVNSIIATANPSVLKNKIGDIKRPSFIEEARCDLEVSLLLEFEGVSIVKEDNFLEEVNNSLLTGLKIAGGDILSFGRPEWRSITDYQGWCKLRRKLMPGYAIVNRRDLVKNEMEKGKDALDAIIDHLKVMHRSKLSEKEKVEWTSKRKTPGWIVPISVGYQGISELAVAKNQRDPDTPHRFAEVMLTLGEFVMPYKLDSLENILWYYQEVDKQTNLYYCTQNN